MNPVLEVGPGAACQDHVILLLGIYTPRGPPPLPGSSLLPSLPLSFLPIQLPGAPTSCAEAGEGDPQEAARGWKGLTDSAILGEA